MAWGPNYLSPFVAAWTGVQQSCPSNWPGIRTTLPTANEFFSPFASLLVILLLSIATDQMRALLSNLLHKILRPDDGIQQVPFAFSSS